MNQLSNGYQTDLLETNNPQTVCKTDNLQIEYIIIDQEMGTQKDRLCCSKCLNGKNWLTLEEAKLKYLTKFQEATSMQHKKMGQYFEELLKIQREEKKEINSALQEISYNLNKIQQDCQQQSRNFQSPNHLNTCEDLNLFAEYIALKENKDKQEKQENLYERYCEKILKEVKDQSKEKLQGTQSLANKIKIIASKMEKKIGLISNTNQENNDDIFNEPSTESVQQQIFEETRFIEYIKDSANQITDQISQIFQQIISQFQKYLQIILRNKGNNQEQSQQQQNLICDPVLEKNVVEDFQNQFNNLVDLIRIKKFCNQIDKAKVHSIEQEEKNQCAQFSENEKTLFYLHANQKIIEQDCDIDSSRKQFKKKIEEIKLQQNQFYQDFKISEDSSWFVAHSYSNEHQYIEIWENQKSNQNKLYQMIYQTSGEEVKQLEVLNNQMFITFDSNGFTIWNKILKEIRPKTINFDSSGFVNAQFDSKKKLLIIQQNYGGKILLYNLQNGIEKISKMELQLQNIVPNIQYSIHFLNQDLKKLFLISYQEGSLQIYKFNQKNKEPKFIAQERLQKGNFFFYYGADSCNFGIILQNKLYISLYQVMKNKENKDKFTISKIYNLYEMGTCLEAKFSQNGKYLTVLNNTQQGKNRLNVYYIKQLPQCLPKIQETFPKIKLEYQE